MCQQFLTICSWLLSPKSWNRTAAQLLFQYYRKSCNFWLRRIPLQKNENTEWQHVWWISSNLDVKPEQYRLRHSRYSMLFFTVSRATFHLFVKFVCNDPGGCELVASRPRRSRVSERSQSRETSITGICTTFKINVRLAIYIRHQA